MNQSISRINTALYQSINPGQGKEPHDSVSRWEGARRGMRDTPRNRERAGRVVCPSHRLPCDTVQQSRYLTTCQYRSFAFPAQLRYPILTLISLETVTLSTELVLRSLSQRLPRLFCCSGRLSLGLKAKACNFNVFCVKPPTCLAWPAARTDPNMTSEADVW